MSANSASASIVALIGRVTRTSGLPLDKQQRATKELLHHRAENEAEQHRRRLAVELAEDVAEQAETAIKYTSNSLLFRLNTPIAQNTMIAGIEQVVRDR